MAVILSCPYCKSYMITVESYHHRTSDIKIECLCENCYATWGEEHDIGDLSEILANYYEGEDEYWERMAAYYEREYGYEDKADEPAKLIVI